VAIWQDELASIFRKGTVDTWTLESWSELFLLPRGKLKRPLWLILAETTAKLGPGWRPAAIKGKDGILRCPDCGAQLRTKVGGDLLTIQNLEKSKKRCTAELGDGDSKTTTGVCGATLWQYKQEDKCWAPADYIKGHMRGVFDYLVCDEVHQMKSEDSARATSFGALVAACRKVIAMTGTLTGGKASHIRSLLFRMNAQSLRDEDLSWTDAMEFARRSGRVDKIVTERESSSDNRRSRGKTRTTREAEQPGLMPTLYGRHLIGNSVFLSMNDVAADLPPYNEYPTPITMCAELAEPYRAMEEKLRAAVKELLRKGSKALLSKMLHALLCYPDYPYDWKEIGYVDKKGGPNGRWVHVCQPPDLNKATLWSKEKVLLQLLKAERAMGRQCWVFAEYTDVHPVLERLHSVVTKAGFKAKILNAKQVGTKTRSEWITKNAPGCDVMISHPSPVGTGMTLFAADGRHNFPTLIFDQTGYNPYVLMQAARRSWRIGQREPCSVHFLYYADTLQSKAMGLMAEKIAASMALAGQLSADGLAAMCGDGGSMQMELARSLAENVDFGEFERTWVKLGGDTSAATSNPSPLALAE
jgi:hypothetical protein